MPLPKMLKEEDFTTPDFDSWLTTSDDIVLIYNKINASEVVAEDEKDNFKKRLMDHIINNYDAIIRSHNEKLRNLKPMAYPDPHKARGNHESMAHYFEHKDVFFAILANYPSSQRGPEIKETLTSLQKLVGLVQKGIYKPEEVNMLKKMSTALKPVGESNQQLSEVFINVQNTAQQVLCQDKLLKIKESIANKRAGYPESWKLGLFGGEERKLAYQTERVPKTVAAIWDIIEKAEKNDQTDWKKTLEKVDQLVSRSASKNVFSQFLTGRSTDTQNFYKGLKQELASFRDKTSNNSNSELSEGEDSQSTLKK